jgi:hypothetical protein
LSACHNALTRCPRRTATHASTTSNPSTSPSCSPTRCELGDWVGLLHRAACDLQRWTASRRPCHRRSNTRQRRMEQRRGKRRRNGSWPSSCAALPTGRERAQRECKCVLLMVRWHARSARQAQASPPCTLPAWPIRPPAWKRRPCDPRGAERECVAELLSQRREAPLRPGDGPVSRPCRCRTSVARGEIRPHRRVTLPLTARRANRLHSLSCSLSRSREGSHAAKSWKAAMRCAEVQAAFRAALSASTLLPGPHRLRAPQS